MLRITSPAVSRNRVYDATHFSGRQLLSLTTTLFISEVFMYEDILPQFEKQAEKRNLRESTIDSYCKTVGFFLRNVGKEVTELTTDDVEAFLTQKRLEGLAPRTYNFYYSGIRFFYRKVLKMNWDDDEFPRMKIDYTLPTVLSREEIQKIIDCTSNLKHKAMISTMYSSGIRDSVNSFV